MEDLKKKYNALLKRYYKATAWMDAPERTEEEKHIHYEKYCKILTALNKAMKELGLKSGDKEILGGFYDDHR